jgi:hypothetical protein
MASGVVMMTLATMATVMLGAAAATPVTPGMKSIGVAIKAATLEKGVEKTVRASRRGVRACSSRSYLSRACEGLTHVCMLCAHGMVTAW